MFTYAAMPLIMLFSFRIFTNKARMLYNALGLSVSLMFATIINTQAPFEAAFIVVPLIVMLVIVRVLEKKGALRDVARMFLSLGLAAIFYLLLVLPISAPYISTIISSGSSFSSELIASHALILNSGWYEGTFPNILSPLFSLSTPTPMSFTDYLGLLIPVVIVVPLFSKDKLKKAVAFPLTVTVLISTLIIRLAATGSPLATMLYEKSFFLLAFIEPTKWYFVLALPLCVLFALGLDEILHHIKLTPSHSRKIKNIKPLFAATLIIIVVSLPIISNNNFLLFNLGRVDAPTMGISGQGGSHEVPSYIYPNLIQLGNTFNELRESEGPFRVLWLPEENYLYSALEIVDPSGVIFPPQNEYLFNYITDIVQNLSPPTTLYNYTTALQFNGVNQYVQVPNSASLNVTKISVGLWFKPAEIGLGSYGWLIGSKGSSSWRLQFQNWNGELALNDFRAGTTDYNVYTSDANIQMGNWYYVVFTFDGSTIKIYLNGVLKGSASATGNYDPMVTGFDIGCGTYNGYVNPFNGTISEIQVYNRAISANEIKSNYNNGVGIPTPQNETGLVGWWPFDEGTGMIAHDLTANSNDGTLYNSPTWVAEVPPTPIGELLAPLAIKYIVVVKEINQTSPIGIWYYEGTPQFIIGNPSDFIQVLSMQSDLEMVNDTSNYVIFENKAFIPMVSSYIGEPDELNQSANAYGAFQGSQNGSHCSIELLNTNPYYSPSEYTIEINTQYPVNLVLSQNYNPSWQAYIINTKGTEYKLTHFEAFGWANGFYTNLTGSYDVEIRFEAQTSVDHIHTLWLVSSLMLITIFLLLTVFPSAFSGAFKKLMLAKKRVD